MPLCYYYNLAKLSIFLSLPSLFCTSKMKPLYNSGCYILPRALLIVTIAWRWIDFKTIIFTFVRIKKIYTA